MIALAFISSESERLLIFHGAIGYAVGVLIFFRIVWGFVGPKYSKWTDFNFNIKKAIIFGLNIFINQKKYLGHNMAASLVMVSLIVVVFFTVFSGILTFGVQEGRGVFSFLNDTFFKDMEAFKKLHEFFANLILVLIAIHLGGVFIENLLHKNDKVLTSIINGYKNFGNEKVTLNIFQKIIAIIFFICVVLVFIYATYEKSILTKPKFSKIDYNEKNPLFANECGSCHMIYPPQTLPKKSWQKMMANLDNHFGDDASLEDEDNQKILSYLLKNSSENSKKEYSVYLLKSMKKDDTISITEIPYWKYKHKNIKKEVFKNPKIKSKSNCKACHSDIEQGLIEDKNIKMELL